MKSLQKYALVTGAGRGLGRAIAEELASEGKNLLLVSLKGEGLHDYGIQLSAGYDIHVECFEIDFMKPFALNELINLIKGYELDILVNNAGLGGSTYFEECDINRIDAIIQINIRTLALLTRMVLPKLKSNSMAFILNIASMASCCPIAYKTVYPASKSFVYSFSRSLSHEMKKRNVYVSVVLAGPISTNAEVKKRINSQGWWVKKGLWTPRQVAGYSIQKMFAKQKVIIPGVINKINWLLLRLLPCNVSIPLVSRAVEHEIAMVKLK